ncbi:glycosyltransferase family 2 protein [Sporocytophaga myxococcoides]|uniref:glycosyltransferase family 2 protein n=1 Tax=Sporocytophaga myxococcoides TaxID=153721 RepID=UPI0003FE10C2|nr:glycosyltransferase family A protein [Sporocytophaga myxococcoides]
MLISVIIPAYNRGDIIIRTLNSILNQNFKDFEVIVVDDGSTDNTEGKVKTLNDSRIVYIKKKVNEERGAARNTGILAASGDYITFVDSDDLFYENHFLTAYTSILGFNRPEVFCQRYEVKNEVGKLLWQMDEMNEHINEKLIEGNFLSCNGVFLRKDIAIKNLFVEDRKLAGLEDWELWLRLASKFRFRFSNIITSSMINHTGRSVYDVKPEILVNRFELFFEVVSNNKDILAFYGNRINKLKASSYTYISLHLAISKRYRLKSIKYLLIGLLLDPLFLMKRRFYAILKYLF